MINALRFLFNMLVFLLLGCVILVGTGLLGQIMPMAGAFLLLLVSGCVLVRFCLLRPL